MKNNLIYFQYQATAQPVNLFKNFLKKSSRTRQSKSHYHHLNQPRSSFKIQKKHQSCYLNIYIFREPYHDFQFISAQILIEINKSLLKFLKRYNTIVIAVKYHESFFKLGDFELTHLNVCLSVLVLNQYILFTISLLL